MLKTMVKVVGPNRTFLYRKGDLSVPIEERYGLWNDEGPKSYVACAACARINLFNNKMGATIQFTRDKLYADARSCVVCIDCGCHFFFTTPDWPVKLSKTQQKLIRSFRRAMGGLLLYGIISDFDEDDHKRYGSYGVHAKRTGWCASIHKYLRPDKSCTYMGAWTEGPVEPPHFPDLDRAIEKVIEKFREHQLRESAR